MLKKIFAASAAALVLAGCHHAATEEKSPEEIEFEQSGRAKAIENETDLWNYFEDDAIGFSVRYPDELRIGSTTEEFGGDDGWALAESRKTLELDGVSAEQFVVFSRFEICNVVFDRELTFERAGSRNSIILSGDADAIIAENPDFFELNAENCGDEKIWNFEKQAKFFADLENGTGSPSAQKWFDEFDAIVDTIEFFEPTATTFDAEKLMGKWTSTEDGKFAIEFSGGEKINFYDGEELDRGNFEISADGLLSVESENEIFEYRIDELDDANLILLFLPRGNILSFARE